MRRDGGIDERFAAYVRERCTAGTVKTHAHRGLRALRDLLGGEFDRQAANETRSSQRDSG